MEKLTKEKAFKLIGKFFREMEWPEDFEEFLEDVGYKLEDFEEACPEIFGEECPA